MDSSGSPVVSAGRTLRSVSEPPDLPPHSPALAKKVTALKNSLVAKRPGLRLGSAKRPGSASSGTPSPLPASNTTARESEEVGHVTCVSVGHVTNT